MEIFLFFRHSNFENRSLNGGEMAQFEQNLPNQCATKMWWKRPIINFEAKSK